MSGGDVCYAGGTNLCAAMGGSKAASGFGEGADAPLVLFDAANASEVLVLSAFDKFGQQRSQASGKEWLGWGPDLSLAPAAHALPAGYNSSACLFGGTGGINHVVRRWGGAMQKVILPPAPGVSNEGRSSPLLTPLPALSWPWVPAWGSLEPPRTDGENAQKTGKTRGKMGKIRP